MGRLEKLGISPKEMKERRKKYLSIIFKGKGNPFYGKVHPFKGKTYDEIFGEERAKEIKAKKSKALKGRHTSPRTEFKKGHKGYKANKGKHVSLEVRKKISQKLKGRKLHNEAWRQMMSKKFSSKNNPFYGKKHTEETRRKIAKKVIQLYLKGVYNRKPTAPERKFIELCKKYKLPFKYVGDGSFWIGRMNPDFIGPKNQKVVIEILGDYWHNPSEFEERKKKYYKHGFKCIGIWEHEIMKNPEIVLEKIKEEGLCQ